jgi:Na+/proline symporter
MSRSAAVPERWTLGGCERFMQIRARKIILITVGVLLLALGLLNTVPDVWRFIRSDASSETLMISNYWVEAAVCGALLCVVGLFFTGKKQR